MSVVRQIFEGETQVNSFDFTDAVPPGATSISSAILQAHTWVSGRPDEDVTTTFLESATGIIDGNEVLFQFEEPEAGFTYRVKCTATFNDGQVLIDRIFYETSLA